jgi:cell division protein FtsB
LTQLREQIIIEKNVIMTENRKLHEENNSLQGEIDKLKALNDALEKNVNKLHSTSTQAK